jgi:hypothetical protein
MTWHSSTRALPSRNAEQDRVLDSYPQRTLVSSFGSHYHRSVAVIPLMIFTHSGIVSVNKALILAFALGCSVFAVAQSHQLEIIGGYNYQNSDQEVYD